LLQLEKDDLEEVYTSFKEITCKTTEEYVGFKARKQVTGLPPEIETACEQRRKARTEMLKNPGDTDKTEQYKKTEQKSQICR
jgi:hypothetical protein